MKFILSLFMLLCAFVFSTSIQASTPDLEESSTTIVVVSDDTVVNPVEIINVIEIYDVSLHFRQGVENKVEFNTLHNPKTILFTSNPFIENHVKRWRKNEINTYLNIQLKLEKTFTHYRRARDGIRCA